MKDGDITDIRLRLETHFPECWIPFEEEVKKRAPFAYSILAETTNASLKDNVLEICFPAEMKTQAETMDPSALQAILKKTIKDANSTVLFTSGPSSLKL